MGGKSMPGQSGGGGGQAAPPPPAPGSGIVSKETMDTVSTASLLGNTARHLIKFNPAGLAMTGASYVAGKVANKVMSSGEDK